MGEGFRFRHNILEISSLNTFTSIKGGINNQCKDVYFVRLQGFYEKLVEDIRSMDQLLRLQMQEGRRGYKRVNHLPRFASKEESDFYANSYMDWVKQNRKEIYIHTSKKNKVLAELLSNAAKDILVQFKKSNPQSNESIEKNFLVKVFFWFDFVAMTLLKNWDIRSSIKIVACNVQKEQEYLFYYFLTLVGFDVLLLQIEKDIEGKVVQLALCQTHVLGSFRYCDIPPYDEVERTANTNRDVPVLTTTNVPAANQTNETEQQVKKPTKQQQAKPPAKKQTRQPAKATSTKKEKTLEQLASLASSVVLIFIHDSSGEIRGSGSGIMIGKNGYILTNCHVASGGTYYSIRIEDDEQIYTTDEIIKYNGVLDLAILRINRSLKTLPIYAGKEKLVRGQRVVAIGSPLGLFNSVSDGIISGFRLLDNVEMIQFTAPISSGSSGGAVLNMQGEVIGISTAGIDSGQNLNLAVGYECINQFIRGFV